MMVSETDTSAGQHRGIGFSSGQQIWQNHAGHFFDSNETGGGIYKYKIQELLKEKKNTKYKYKIMLASSFLAIGQLQMEEEPIQLSKKDIIFKLIFKMKDIIFRKN